MPGFDALPNFFNNLTSQWMADAEARPEEERARQLELEALEAVLGGGPKGRPGLTAPTREEITAQLGPSALGGIKLDPTLRAAQLEALDKYGQAMRGQDDMEYRAQMEGARRETSNEAAAQQAAIRSSLAAHGGGGGLGEAALREQAVQSAAGRNAQMGFSAAAEAQRRAIDAAGTRAGLAGRMEGADYERAAELAGATDRVNAFNAQSRAAGAQNAFNNQMRVVGAQNDARTTAAAGARDEAERRRRRRMGEAQMVGNAMSGVSDAATSFLGFK